MPQGVGAITSTLRNGIAAALFGTPCTVFLPEQLFDKDGMLMLDEARCIFVKSALNRLRYLKSKK